MAQPHLAPGQLGSVLPLGDKLAQTLEKFYRAFAALDSATMRSCYAPDVRFEDEVFTLRGVDEVAVLAR